MYNQFDDEVFLAPETSVSLHFEEASGDGAQEWDIAAGEALERAERNAWARHALRANGLAGVAAACDEDDEDRSQDLRDAIRHVLTLSWD